MTLDDVLRSSLQWPNVRAIALFDKLYIPLAVRGTVDKTDLQLVISRISWTMVGTVGQIALNDGRLAQFHHADTHTVVLIKDPLSTPDLIETHACDTDQPNKSSFENTVGSPSSTSTATPTRIKEHRPTTTSTRAHAFTSSSSSKPISAPVTTAGVGPTISTISASVETIKGWSDQRSDKSSN